MVKFFEQDFGSNVGTLGPVFAGKEACPLPYSLTILNTQAAKDLGDYQNLKVRFFWEVKGLGRLYVLSP